MFFVWSAIKGRGGRKGLCSLDGVGVDVREVVEHSVYTYVLMADG